MSSQSNATTMMNGAMSLPGTAMPVVPAMPMPALPMPTTWGSPPVGMPTLFPPMPLPNAMSFPMVPSLPPPPMGMTCFPELGQASRASPSKPSKTNEDSKTNDASKTHEDSKTSISDNATTTAAPVVPKATPVVPKAAPVIPKAAPVIPKAAPVVPKAAPVAPKAASVAPKAASVAPKTAPVVKDAKSPNKSPPTKNKTNDNRHGPVLPPLGAAPKQGSIHDHRYATGFIPPVPGPHPSPPHAWPAYPYPPPPPPPLPMVPPPPPPPHASVPVATHEAELAEERRTAAGLRSTISRLMLKNRRLERELQEALHNGFKAEKELALEKRRKIRLKKEKEKAEKVKKVFVKRQQERKRAALAALVDTRASTRKTEPEHANEKNESGNNEPKSKKAKTDSASGQSVGTFDTKYDMQWLQMLEELKKFKEEFGHCHVPMTDTKLARWVSGQRTQYSNLISDKWSTLTPERVRELKAIGFLWKAKPNAIRMKNMDRLEQLRAYKEKFGHCNVPQKCTEFPGLGNFVLCQRRSYRRGQLSQDQIEYLESMGFEWSLRNRGGTLEERMKKWQTKKTGNDDDNQEEKTGEEEEEDGEETDLEQEEDNAMSAKGDIV